MMRLDDGSQTHVSMLPLVKLWAGLMLVALMLVISNGACNCSETPGPSDASETTNVTPEKKANSPTQIRFISPVAGDIISGQITIEAEVIDADGMDSVTFLINDGSIGQGKLTKDSTKAKPRYSVQVATTFQPRGVLSLTVRTVDLTGEKAEKTIQVTTRERWAAAFGVGTIHQLEIRDDKHMFIRLFRSEDDMARVLNPGPRDKVGAALLTANAVGQASWLYLGPGEEFSDFVLDAKGNTFFGARSMENSKSRLVALGRGDNKWGPEIPITPKWEADLKELLVQGKPIRWAESLWVHLVKPAQGGEPASAALVRYKAESGTEDWRYTGTNNEKMEIIRGPYLFGQGMILMLSRKAGSSSGFRAEIVDGSGKQVWLKAYNGLRLNVVQWDASKERLYIGAEQREQSKVTASSVICLDPAGKQECWRKEFGTSWPEKLSLGGSTLCVARNPEGSTKEVLSLQKSDGAEVWKQSLDKRRITGVLAIAEDACFVFSDVLDDADDPETMLVERYSKQGSINWRYENQQFTAKNWLFVSQASSTLWVVVRGITDDVERLGSKVLALDDRGKRMYLFHDESRIFNLLKFSPNDSLFVTSRDLRDARVHHLIPIR